MGHIPRSTERMSSFFLFLLLYDSLCHTNTAFIAKDRWTSPLLTTPFYDVVVKSSRSLSHPLMSFLYRSGFTFFSMRCIVVLLGGGFLSIYDETRNGCRYKQKDAIFRRACARLFFSVTGCKIKDFIIAEGLVSLFFLSVVVSLYIGLSFFCLLTETPRSLM